MVTKMKNVLVTGSEGFIGSYLCSELLEKGYTVYGIDNFSKYGFVKRRHSIHPNFIFKSADISNKTEFEEALKDWEFDVFIAMAAMIGGISYFHTQAYDLLAINERIMANSFDVAIERFQKNQLEKIVVVSSSMVFESTNKFPSEEGDQFKCPPPLSTYGFQKLACEYFAKGAWEQYKLPYVIVRPFNCIGIGEDPALTEKEVYSGNIKLLMSHVVPDLILKTLKGQDPLHILGDGSQIRHFTNGKDIARGIRLAMEHPEALNEDFNISNSRSTTVLELAEMIWKKINPEKPFRYISDAPFPYDVQKRVPSIEKAKRLLGFEAQISLEESLDEIIAYIKEGLELGRY